MMTWIGGSLGERGMALAHALVFADGAVTGLSPCALPTVALVIAWVGGRSTDRRSALALSGAFVGGLALTLAALGSVASSIGGLVRDTTVMTFAAAAICGVMGLGLLGVCPVRVPQLSVLPGKGTGVIGAFILGIPFGFIASPCTTPVTAAVLAFAAVNGNPLFGATLLFTFAIGRSIPLLAGGLFAAEIARLSWLERVSGRLQTVSGVVLLLLALYLVWTVV